MSMFFGAYQDVLVHLPNNKKQDGFFILFQHFIQGLFLLGRLKKQPVRAVRLIADKKLPPPFVKCVLRMFTLCITNVLC